MKLGSGFAAPCRGHGLVATGIQESGMQECALKRVHCGLASDTQLSSRILTLLRKLPSWGLA